MTFHRETANRMQKHGGEFEQNGLFAVEGVARVSVSIAG